MKKIILMAALALGFTVAAVAQPRAVGIRGSYGVEVSYQHTVGSNFIEADLGFMGLGINAAATYNWNLVQFGDAFNVYAGPGAAVGLGFNPGWFNVGIAGMVGLEYNFKPTFNVPIQLSIDVRPQLGVSIMGGAADSDSASDTKSVAMFGFWGWYPSLGIRYAF